MNEALAVIAVAVIIIAINLSLIAGAILSRRG